MADGKLLSFVKDLSLLIENQASEEIIFTDGKKLLGTKKIIDLINWNKINDSEINEDLKRYGYTSTDSIDKIDLEKEGYPESYIYLKIKQFRIDFDESEDSILIFHS